MAVATAPDYLVLFDWGDDMTNGERWARRFHERYEELAPGFGYETRADTKEFDPLSRNGQLMQAVCADIIAERDAEIAEWAKATAFRNDSWPDEILVADLLAFLRGADDAG